MIAKRKTVLTFGLVSGLRVSKVPTVTGIGGVVVAKRRTVVTFGLVSGLRVSKVPTVTGIGGVVVAKCRTVVTFGLLERKGLEGKRVTRGEERETYGSHALRFLHVGHGVSKVSTVTMIGGSWSRNAEVSSLLALPLERGEERGERRKER